MVYIYLSQLKDYRRAIIEADDLLENFTADRETRASAWLYKAVSYRYLHDYDKSRESAEVILSDYDDCEYERQAAESLLELLPPVHREDPEG
jgi:tetratricopeptide (TPR) repeat protein